MAWSPQIKDPQPGDSVERSVMWPYVYAPLIWILLIHLGTRFMWILGYK